VPGQTATTTAGIQPAEMIGPQLPSLIACATEAIATNAAASPAAAYSHLFQDPMASPLLSSVLVIDKLA
jgi:hypothetical protein